MYYKIINKKCNVYKKLYELRTSEIKMGEDNVIAIKNKVGLSFETYVGYSGQQNVYRVTEYEGFKFTDPEKVNLKLWKLDKEFEGLYVPNKKTKLGREMAEFLLNGIQKSNFMYVFKILKMETSRRFTFPYVEIVNDIILLYLGETHEEPKDINIIEITKKEWFNILKAEV
jgi:hypothetical protein